MGSRPQLGPDIQPADGHLLQNRSLFIACSLMLTR